VNALQVLEVLAAAEGSVGVTELADQLRIAPSTVHRTLATLTATGFARRGPDRRYYVGPAVTRLAPRATTPLLLRDAARPILRWLAETTGETIHLAVLDGTSVVTIDHAAGARADAAAHVVGGRVPAHATAVGLALLAHHPEIVDAVVATGLRRWTADTIADAATLGRRLVETRRRGYAVNRRGWLDGTAGVAAPVLLANGDAVASVGISGPIGRLGRNGGIASLGALVGAGARAVAARLATEPPTHETG
jgi:DNA-binding IclR family transcriptional regulator